MPRILVIDDEKAIRNTLKEVLEYEKHEVDLAEDGTSGIELFSSNTYDVVLCDIKMQKMDGIEVLEKINADDPALIPVVLLESDHYIHKTYGKIFSPVFKIAKWVAMDGAEEAQEPEAEEKPRRRRRKAS